MRGKNSKPQTKRSGLYKRKKLVIVKRAPRQSPEDLKRAMDELFNGLTFDGRVETLSANIEALELIAKTIYSKHGLPIESGIYIRADDGHSWTLIDPESALDASLGLPPFPTRVQLFARPGLGVRQFGPDHETAFAGDLFNSLEHLQRLFEKAKAEQNLLAIEAMQAAFVAMADVTKWREEFDLSVWIAPERASAAGRARGGAEKAKVEDRASVWSTWQAPADEIWARNPLLPASAVARTIKARLGLPDDVGTIRKRIKNKARC